MDILWLIIGVLVHFFAVPLLIIALIWFFFIARRLYREKKSLDAFKDNEAARAMTKERLKAGFIRALGILSFPILLAGLSFLLVTAGVSGEAVPAIVMAVSSVVSGFFLLWSGRIKKRYSGGFKENIVKVELAKVFDKLSYEPERALEPELIQNLNFFQSFDRFSGNDLIRAAYKGLDFVQCDMGVQERYTVTVTDSDGDSRTEERWRDVFQGRAMRFEFADGFRGKVQVVSKDFDGAMVRQSRNEWQTVETELAEFGEYFEVYALDPLDAMAVLTPQMIEGIFYLKKALDVPTALYFSGNSMTVFLALARNAFDVSGKHTLLEETKLLERDIALMSGFMEVMYFKRQAGGEDSRPAENNRAETAASVAAAAGLSGATKLARQARRGLGLAFGLLPKLIIAVYLISAVYGFIKLPDGLALGITLGDNGWAASPDAPRVPAIGFLIVAGVFIGFSAIKRSFIFSGICLALYLLFIAANL